jgi:DNA repair exonuclease SbcCD ATPase subunit
MSKQIVGDVAVGRHVYTGGDANVAGSVTIKGNVKVDGWLDAKNIKHTNKGLFPSLDALNEAYPEPKRGWYALVGETIPAKIYIVEDGEWKDSNKMSRDLNVDLTNYVTKGKLETELAEVTETSNNAITIANEASAQVGAMGDQIANNQSAIAVLQSSTEQTDNKVSQLESTLSEHSLNIEIYDSRINENTESIAKHRSDVVKDVARLDAKNAEQDEQISNAVKNANDAIGFTTAIEGQVQNLRDEVGVKNTQVDNKLATIETLNAKQTLWHEAHSIINLHRFITPSVIDRSIFPEYMGEVPSQLVRIGLIVMVNTPSGWESWQFVNDMDLNSLESYKKLDWDNSLVLTEINALKSRIATEVSNLQLEDDAINGRAEEMNIALTAEIDLRKANDAEQDGKISDIENQVNAQQLLLTNMEGTLANHTDDVATLFAKIEALEAKVLKLEDFHYGKLEPVDNA